MARLQPSQPPPEPPRARPPVEPVDSGPIPEQVLQLEQAVAVRSRHEQLAARDKPLPDQLERVPELVVVEMLEDLGGNDRVEWAGELLQVDGLQGLGLEPGLAQQPAPVLDALL